MTNNRLARQVDMAGTVLRVVAWLVLIVGIVWAAALVWSGYDAVEPWSYAGFTATSDTNSIVWGWFSGAAALISAAAWWAVLLLLGGWAEYLSWKIDRHPVGGAGYAD